MKIPNRKDGPKLPPPQRGGRSAARQHQFQMERGLAEEPLPEDLECTKSDDDYPSNADRKKPKPKS